jgi:hypothetical protein
MDPQESFKDWYKTEGIRTPAPMGEHGHEFYQRIAYEAGAKAAMEYCINIVDKVEELLKKK